MKFEKTEVFNFKGALRGMRNPKESWHLSDSHYKDMTYIIETINKPVKIITENEISSNYIIGEKDMKLAQTLIRAGSEHRKFLRQIFVCVDITAPLYWWKEFDTYKVGTVANSTSTMHKMASKPITLDCFEIGDYESKALVSDMYIDYKRPTEVLLEDKIEDLIDWLEDLRKRYLETKDKRYWKELIRWLPESWLQTRTVTMNYENLLGMCSKGQRRFHKLSEWSEDFINWARSLPYAQEFIFIDELKKTKVDILMELLASVDVQTIGEDGDPLSTQNILEQITKKWDSLPKELRDKIIELIIN